MKIRVHEIFNSVSGECGAIPQGAWTTFIRLAGCNLRCSWCDTIRAQRPEDGEEIEMEGLFRFLNVPILPNILITGGEPLLQMEAVEDLVHRMWFEYVIQIETNGSLYPSDLIARHACLVFDRKLGSSGMKGAMQSLEGLSAVPSGSMGEHWLKMVVASEEDYQEAREVLHILERIRSPLQVAFSAAPPGMPHDRLFQLMRRDGLAKVRLSVQIHKLAGLGENNC